MFYIGVYVVWQIQFIVELKKNVPWMTFNNFWKHYATFKEVLIYLFLFCASKYAAEMYWEGARLDRTWSAWYRIMWK